MHSHHGFCLKHRSWHGLTLRLATVLLATWLLATLLLVTLPSKRVFGETYTVDPAHTSVLFSVGHMQPPVSYTYGFFRKISGSFVLDRTNPSACQFQFSIDVQSIDTNNAKRDDHLRGPDFFNAQQFQQITFQSTACILAPAEPGAVVYNVTGNLTMLGQVRQVTLPLRFVGESNDTTGHRAGMLSQFTIKRSDFGMTGMLNMVGDAIGVTVSMEGVEQKFVPRTDVATPSGQASPVAQPTPAQPTPAQPTPAQPTPAQPTPRGQ